MPTHSLEVLGLQLVAQEAGRCAHGLLDDPGALGDAGDELEGVVAPRLRILAVASRQKPVHAPIIVSLGQGIYLQAFINIITTLCYVHALYGLRRVIRIRHLPEP